VKEDLSIAAFTQGKKLLKLNLAKINVNHFWEYPVYKYLVENLKSYGHDKNPFSGNPIIICHHQLLQ